MANGLLTIQGLQTSIPQGSAPIGPFSIPLSPIGATILAPYNATTTILVPSTTLPSVTQGVVLVANATSGMTCSAGFIAGELTRFNPLGYPCVWTWDENSIPTDVYVTVSNTAGALVTVQFF